MPVPAQYASFWSAFLEATGSASDGRYYEAFHFGDSADLAAKLADLVLTGVKRATASAVWAYEAEGQALPRPGDLSIVTDWDGNPLCVIETQALDVVPLGEVSAEFAAVEGEGDGSLAFWRAAHESYFRRECARLGRQFTGDMPVACERFRVVWRPAATASA